MSPTSMSFSVPSIYAALLEVQQFMGGDSELQLRPQSTDQQRFCEFLATAPASYIEMLPEIKTEAGSPAVVNAFFKRHNFDIEVSGDWAVGAILDVLVEWLKMGQPSRIEIGEREYDAFCLEKGVSFHNIDGRIVVSVKTRTQGRRAFMTLSGAPSDLFELWTTVSSLTANESNQINSYDMVVSPMINHSFKPDIGFLVGLEGKYLPMIQDAAQQNRLRMNHHGARAESATGLGLECTRFVRLYQLNGPFLFWIMDEGLKMPLFAAYLDSDSWSDPGDL